MEVFPVGLVPTDRVIRRPDGKRCPRDRIWYADWHDVQRGRFKHNAQDIFAPIGSNVLAPERLRIMATSGATPSRKGGFWVKGVAPSRRVYYFAHLEKPPAAVPGETVEAGALLGHVGRSGNAQRTCPHLHIAAYIYQRGGGRLRVNLFPELKRLDPTVGGRLPKPPPKDPPTPETTTEEATCPN